MAKKSTKTNFIMQGSILAAAGILVRLIGLIYRVPLDRILGVSGAAAYSTAFDVYSLFLLISSLSLPLAVSKIVSARVALKEYKNANKAFCGALAMATVIGLVVGTGVYVGAEKLAELWGFPSASIAIKILAPTLFIMCILGVFRGFFQGMGTMIPTAVSQIFEQIVNAVVSIVAAMYLYKAGEKIGQESAYSAAGGTLGTACGALTALLFMIFVYVIFREPWKRTVYRDRHNSEESYEELGKILAMTIFPVLLSTTIYNFGTIMDSGIYGNVMRLFFGLEEAEYSGFWGIYSNKYRVLTTAPIAIASAFSSAMIPSLMTSLMSGKKKELRSKVDSTIRLNMIVAFPCGVGLSMLAGPIIEVLFPTTELYEECVHLMRLSVFIVVISSLSTITNSILQGIDQMKLPVIHSAISLGLHVFVILILLVVFRMNVYGVALADVIFAAVVCFLNVRAIKQHLNYKQEVVKSFLLPGVASGIMGISSYFVYRFIRMVSGSVGIGLILAIIFAVFVYGIMLFLFDIISEDELRMLPKGYKLVPIVKKVGLMK